MRRKPLSLNAFGAQNLYTNMTEFCFKLAGEFLRFEFFWALIKAELLSNIGSFRWILLLKSPSLVLLDRL